MNWLINFFRKLFGDWSSPSSALQNFGESGSNSNLVGLVNKGHASPASATLSDVFSSIVASLTGAHLTGAQREANAFTAEREDLAWARQLEASNTQYQRATKDMLAAGLNPILAAGAGTTTPSATVAGGVSPSAASFNLPALLSLMQQASLVRSQVANTEADTIKKQVESSKIETETAGSQILNHYLDESERLRLQGLGLTNDLTSHQISVARKQVSQIEQSIKLQIEQEKNEVAKRSLIEAQALLERANVYQILQLLPYQKALQSAQTDAARQAAALSAVNAAYQNRLIDEGYIAETVRKVKADATKSEQEAIIAEVKRAFRTGKTDHMSKLDNWSLQNVYQPIVNVLDNLNPLAGLFK